MSEHAVWKTKGGNRVLILGTDKPEGRPIEGLFINHRILTGPYFWTANGIFFLSGEPSGYDLIIPEGVTIGERK